MKKNRHKKIIEIIEKYDVETQEELASCLKQMGIEVTQATVSRDIKEMQLVKIPYGTGRYRYAFPPESNHLHNESKMQRLFREVVKRIEFSENMVVIKTQPGAGSSVAFCLDNAHWDEIMGTIAGDDTVFVVVRHKEFAEDIVQRMDEMAMGM